MTPGNWQSITFGGGQSAGVARCDDVTTSARAVADGTTTPAQLMSSRRAELLHAGTDGPRRPPRRRPCE